MVRDPSLYTGSKGHKNDFSQVSGGRSMGTDDGTSPRPRSLRPVVTIVLAMLCSFVILEGTRQAQFHVATGLARIEGAASKILGNIEQLQGKLIASNLRTTPSPVHAGANAVGLGASTTRSQASSSAQTSLSQVRPSIYMSDRQHTHTHLHILPGADRGFLGDNIAGWQARPRYSGRRHEDVRACTRARASPCKPMPVHVHQDCSSTPRSGSQTDLSGKHAQARTHTLRYATLHYTAQRNATHKRNATQCMPARNATQYTHAGLCHPRHRLGTCGPRGVHTHACIHMCAYKCVHACTHMCDYTDIIVHAHVHGCGNGTRSASERSDRMTKATATGDACSSQPSTHMSFYIRIPHARKINFTSIVNVSNHGRPRCPTIWLSPCVTVHLSAYLSSYLSASLSSSTVAC